MSIALNETLNETHDAGLKSWVASANVDGTDFPIQNLPYGVFRRRQSDESFRVGVAIGDQILDLTVVRGSGAFADAEPLARQALDAAASSTVNALMALGQPAEGTTVPPPAEDPVEGPAEGADAGGPARPS